MGVVVVAAGSSRRMEGIDKVFLPLAGQPLVAHSLQVFEHSIDVDKIALVLSESAQDDGERLVTELGLSKVVAVTAGGARRQDSVFNGMEMLSDCGILMIHDGARPFVSADIIARGLEVVGETGAATAAVSVKDTIKIVDSEMVVRSTPERATLWAAQTPQVFDSQLLMEAHKQVNDDATDDAGMVEALGADVKVFMGSYENIKVTTPEDVALAETIFTARTLPLGRNA
ncbi:MAG: 2-C-methyl-D-erythritol 4-phosphate cytidylyltransferase [SAR202 cluster bacterium]|nr:2-C-methyl-D-erythritol 4-phosphate cytidylyltransferase [SAR202 cluster bacterium]